MAKVDEHSTDWYLSLILTKVEGMEKTLENIDKRLDEGDKRFQSQEQRIRDLEESNKTHQIEIDRLNKVFITRKEQSIEYVFGSIVLGLAKKHAVAICTVAGSGLLLLWAYIKTKTGMQ